jgi:hypothetical protein
MDERALPVITAQQERSCHQRQCRWNSSACHAEARTDTLHRTRLGVNESLCVRERRASKTR